MEYFPKVEVLQIMQSCENALHETVSAGQVVQYTELMTTISSLEITLRGGGEDPSVRGSYMTYREWLCRILDLLSLSCEGSTEMIKTSSVELSPLLGGSSLELNSEDTQAFHRVANLLSFKYFLFGSKVNGHVSTNESDVFLEKISIMMKRWNQAACDSILEQWQECDVDDRELAKKTLYQWTHTILEVVTKVVTEKMTMWEMKGDYVEAARLGGDYIDFLVEYNGYLDPDETEFLYSDFYFFYNSTAKLHIRLGEYEQSEKLCEELLRIFNRVEDDGVKIPIWPQDKVAYIQPSAITTRSRRDEVLGLMETSLRAQKKDITAYKEQYKKNWSELKQLHPGDEIVPVSPESLWNPYLSQLMEMAILIEAASYSEAEKVFERYKEETAYEESVNPGTSLYSRLRSMRHWLEFHYLEMFSTEIYPSCVEYSSSEWQALCRKFELVLDMTEFVGDPLLKAEIMKEYGYAIGQRCLYKSGYKINKGKPVEADEEDNATTYHSVTLQDYTDKLERWLKEELGIPITTTNCVQEATLLACFSEPCSPGEHKRHLPPVLKSYRLMKCYMDTFSQLLHNWTQGSEARWLKLLESQKSAHASMQEYLLHISEYCLQYMEIVENLEGNGLGRSSSSRDPVFRAMYEASTKSTLVWAERGRARSLFHQLGPAYVDLHDDTNLKEMRQDLTNFDLDEKRAFSSIMACHWACEGAVFVEYILSYYNSAVFVTYRDPGEKQAFKLAFQFVQFKCDENRVAKLVEDFYKKVTPVQGQVNYTEEEIVGYLEELYNMLVRPIWPQVAQFLRSKLSKVVFVPDKILNRVPFALLRDLESQKHLFELHPIAVAPSLRVLHHCSRRLSYLEKCPMKPGKSVIAIGGAAYSEETQLLPGSGIEVAELSDRFPGLVHTLQNYSATSANLLALLEESTMSHEAHAFGLIHLGVHCHWNDTYKTGAIQFAKPDERRKLRREPTPTDTSRPLKQDSGGASSSRDGEKLQSAFGEVGAVMRSYGFKNSTSSCSGKEMLQSEDIIACGLQWPTRLVVLSACNSSKGQIFGDGEVNLPRALMIAGVPATLVAQWKVVDKASPKLMRDFYEGLQRGQDVATAIQSTMLHALQEHGVSKIHEWGPFVVWGLPSVQLPKELWREDAKTALIGEFDSFVREDIMSNVFKLQTFLSTSNTNNNGFEDTSVVYDAIYTALKFFNLRNTNSFNLPYLEQVFIKVPLEHLHKFEIMLLQAANEPEKMIQFRWCMRYAQAIKGNFQVALDYANVLVADQASPDHLLHRQERAVVLRLLGKHAEALLEFDDLLAPGFDYECHIERSCVKYLMGDTDGALEEARHAHRTCPARDSGLLLLLISFRAIPPGFCAWISNVCNTSNLCCHLLVPPEESSSARQVATSPAALSEVTDGPLNFDDDPALLEQALAMSMAETSLAESGGNDDQDLALAQQMSMQEQC